jgi:histidinol-phosphate/aromatic aminotransferase/cobyric acid decarboxylase-like protein
MTHPAVDSVRPEIRSLQPYVPGKPVEELERELGIAGAVKLASNENPLGPSPLAVAAISVRARREPLTDKPPTTCANLARTGTS